MFEPNNDRIDYGKLLTPPDGYALDFAVGTTYSLDLDALVGACMSLGLGEETDSELLQNPLYMLDTLHRTGDKLALFCEGGQIKLPSKVTKLHALLEKIVFEVAMPKRRGTAAYPSFHPKFWLIRYRKDNEQPKYRVIVLSRNLTFDRSWDFVFAMDGERTQESTGKNSPVKDFLSFLTNYLPKDVLGKEKRRGIKSLISDLNYVHFELNTKSFSDFEFIPIGVCNTTTDIRTVLGLSAKRYDELMVISPFLSNGEIKSLNNIASTEQNAEAILITRRESLSKLNASDCDKFRILCMRDEVVNGESIQSDGEENAQNVKQQDIHAKIYLSRKYSFQSAVELCLGSMNASHNAVCGNIEFLIRLKTVNRYFNLAKFKEDLFGKDESRNPFEEVNLSEASHEEVVENSRLDAIIKAICRASTHATVSPDGEHYNVKLTVDKLAKIELDESEVYLSPLFAEEYKRQIAEEITFEGLSLNQLTSFYRISVIKGDEHIERVIIVPTDGIPETRDNSIVTSIVSSQQSFLQYLSFLLGDDPTLGALEAESRGRAGNGRYEELSVALYEKMLEVAAHEPSRFKEIDFLMKAITADGIIPQGFTELYETFKKVVKTDE